MSGRWLPPTLPSELGHKRTHALQKTGREESFAYHQKRPLPSGRPREALECFLLRRVCGRTHARNACGRAPNDFATSRVHSRKRSTTGLRVRFFNVTIATGHGRIGRATGSIASENLSAYGPRAGRVQ